MVFKEVISQLGCLSKKARYPKNQGGKAELGQMRRLTLMLSGWNILKLEREALRRCEMQPAQEPGCFRATFERVATVSSMKAELKRMWKEKRVLACRRVLEKVDRFLEQAGEVVSQEGHLKTLEKGKDKLREIAQLTEGDTSERSEDRLQEIPEEIEANKVQPRRWQKHY